MTRVMSNAEETVLNIVNDSKKNSHKLSGSYQYEVNTEDLDIICVLLLNFNKSVEVKKITNTISTIQITHITSKQVPMLKYSVSLADESTDEVPLSSLAIDDKMKSEVIISMSNVIDMIKFDEN